MRQTDVSEQKRQDAKTSENSQQSRASTITTVMAMAVSSRIHLQPSDGFGVCNLTFRPFWAPWVVLRR